ncbi:hypothetical protein LX36DRAFT_715879 [Colletotrichum falcatum]|nr:hypothetical protein LX36DRAFT_715879 [Colletotrichum falcatum]
MTATYFDSVTSKGACDRRRTASESTSATTSLAVLGHVPTSSWDESQLLACRVFVSSCNDRNFLPIFAGIRPDPLARSLHKRLRAERPTSTAARSDLSPEERALLQLEKLCRGPRDTAIQTEHRHVWMEGNSLGQIWAALDLLRSQTAATRTTRIHDPYSSPLSLPPSSPPVSVPNLPSSPPALQPRPVALLHPHSSPVTRTMSGRVSKPPSRPGFTPSFEEALSSSPPSSSSMSAAHSNYVGEEEASADDAQYPEVLTVRFVSAFLRYALPWLPGQDDASADAFVAFSDRPAVRNTFQLGSYGFASLDDGGLDMVIFGKPTGRVAILEAKRKMGRAVDGKPLLSDGYLGQMVGEALAARLEHDAWKGPNDCIIVILAARHYIRFLQVKISDDYVAQLKERSYDDKAPFTEYICVTATRWFDLHQADDRCETILNLATIVKLAHDRYEG